MPTATRLSAVASGSSQRGSEAKEREAPSVVGSASAVVCEVSGSYGTLWPWSKTFGNNGDSNSHTSL